MTNEQREAIEYLKESVLIYKNTIPKLSQAIETVLSLITKQEEKIETTTTNYKNLIADVSGIAKELGLEEDATIDEIYTAIRILKSKRINVIEQLDCIEKKDKQIDLMAEYISKRDVEEDICMKNKTNPDWCNEDYTNCQDCIKKYFADLVEKE